MNKNFLTISVDEWQQNVSAYLDTSKNVLNKYLQSYPFSVLNKEEKTILKWQIVKFKLNILVDRKTHKGL